MFFSDAPQGESNDSDALSNLVKSVSRILKCWLFPDCFRYATRGPQKSQRDEHLLSSCRTMPFRPNCLAITSPNCWNTAKMFWTSSAFWSASTKVRLNRIKGKSLLVQLIVHSPFLAFLVCWNASASVSCIRTSIHKTSTIAAFSQWFTTSKHGRDNPSLLS